MQAIKRTRLIGTLVGVPTALLMLSGAVNASEGLVEMTNRVNQDARCFAASVLMQDLNYKVLVSCRDIVYPGGSNIINYIVWANPVSGSSAVRLGSLNLGKVEFRTKQAFSSLFVTVEKTSNVRAPEGQVVMQGSLQSIKLLDGNQPVRTGSPTPTPKGQTESPMPTIEGEPTPTPQPRSGIARFITGGILSVLGIAGIIFIVFILTKR